MYPQLITFLFIYYLFYYFFTYQVSQLVFTQSKILYIYKKK